MFLLYCFTLWAKDYEHGGWLLAWNLRLRKFKCNFIHQGLLSASPWGKPLLNWWFFNVVDFVPQGYDWHPTVNRPEVLQTFKMLRTGPMINSHLASDVNSWETLDLMCIYCIKSILLINERQTFALNAALMSVVENRGHMASEGLDSNF